jgi:hypothetical protein
MMSSCTRWREGVSSITGTSRNQRPSLKVWCTPTLTPDPNV